VVGEADEVLGRECGCDDDRHCAGRDVSEHGGSVLGVLASATRDVTRECTNPSPRVRPGNRPPRLAAWPGCPSPWLRPHWPAGFTDARRLRSLPPSRWADADATAAPRPG